MFVYDAWYIAGLQRDVADKPVRRLLLGQPVVLFRTRGGSAVALEDRCIHRHAPLSLGAVTSDGNLQCLYHGMVFDRQGACVSIPEQDRIPAEVCVRSYPVVECGQWIWVWMGAPEKADESQIPAYPWFSMPGWSARTGHLHVKCNYRHIIDNLLNMAHLPFVHPRTIGSEGVVRDAKVSVTRTDKGVRLSRKMYDIEPPPTYKQAAGFTGNVNRWQNIDFIAPACFEFDTGVIEVGHEIPDTSSTTAKLPNARILSRHTMHGLAPETATTTNYYVGFSYDPAAMSESTADFVFDSVYKTFIEDVVVLEAIEDNMRLAPDARMTHIVSDGAGIQALRRVDELIRAETLHRSA